jgi:hypothetical protein
MISIILTTYNDSHFLTTAIPSCVAQNVSKEIILVDDCSSAEIIPAVRDLISAHGIKVIRHSKNQGLSAARNTGISAAANEHVIPLDADDWFYPDAVKTLFEAAGDADVVAGYCTDSGTIYKPGIFHGPLTKEMFIENNPVVCSSLFKKSIWSKVGGYMVRETCHYEDWNFWARCFAAGAKFKALDLMVYNHTSRPDSMLRILHPNGEFYRRLATDGVFK